MWWKTCSNGEEANAVPLPDVQGPLYAEVIKVANTYNQAPVELLIAYILQSQVTDKQEDIKSYYHVLESPTLKRQYSMQSTKEQGHDKHNMAQVKSY